MSERDVTTPRGSQGEGDRAQRSARSDRPRTGTGPGRILVAVYAVLALAATGRSAVQIWRQFDEAPLAYVLSAVAAVVYVVATVALARGDRTSTRVATVAITVELVGVLTVGVASYLVPSAFPDKTVWSHFGQGYGYVPLVLPVLGLWWLRTVRRRDAADPQA
jgi:cytochrome bd-type quinol oxidase subunit 2